MTEYAAVVVPLGHAVGYGRDSAGAMFRVVRLAGRPVAVPKASNAPWVAAHKPLGGAGEPLASLRARLPGNDDGIDWLLANGLLVEAALDPTGQWASTHRLAALAHRLGPAERDSMVGFGVGAEPQALVEKDFGDLLVMADAFGTIADAVQAAAPTLSAGQLADGLFRCLASNVAYIDPAGER